MIFAVAMTFIDQTIVSIAVPEIQKELGPIQPSAATRIPDRCPSNPRRRWDENDPAAREPLGAPRIYRGTSGAICRLIEGLAYE
jgi:hypothetical protein